MRVLVFRWKLWCGVCSAVPPCFPGWLVGVSPGSLCAAPPQRWTSWRRCLCWTPTSGSQPPRPLPTLTSPSTMTRTTSPRPSPTTRASRAVSWRSRNGRVSCNATAAKWSCGIDLVIESMKPCEHTRAQSGLLDGLALPYERPWGNYYY